MSTPGDVLCCSFIGRHFYHRYVECHTPYGGGAPENIKLENYHNIYRSTIHSQPALVFDTLVSTRPWRQLPHPVKGAELVGVLLPLLERRLFLSGISPLMLPVLELASLRLAYYSS